MIIERSPPIAGSQASPNIQYTSIQPAEPVVHSSPVSAPARDSLNDLKRQLSQALAKDAHTQAALAHADGEKGKLKRQLAEAEAQLAQARQDTDAIREREALRDHELAQQREKMDSARDKAAAAELAEQNRKHKANVQHRDAKHAWERAIEDWTLDSKRSAQIDAINERKDRIMAEHAAFEESCRLRRAQLRIRQLEENIETDRDAAVDHDAAVRSANEQISSLKDDLKQSRQKHRDIKDELKQSQQSHRDLLDSIQEYKQAASRWEAECTNLRKQKGPSPTKPSPRKPVAPALDLDSSSATSSEAEERKPVATIRKAKAPTPPSASSSEEVPRVVVKREKVKAKETAQPKKTVRKEAQKPRLVEVNEESEEETPRASAPTKGAKKASKAKSPSPLPIEEDLPEAVTQAQPRAKKKIKLHGKRTLDQWEQTHGLIPNALTPIKPAGPPAKKPSILARKNF